MLNCTLACLFAALVCVACHFGESEEVPADAAPEYLGPYPTAVDPDAGAEGVFIDKVVRVTFNDHLDAHLFAQNRFSLTSGKVSKWLLTYWDPVHKQLVAWPSSNMRRSATWIFALQPGLLGLDGEMVAPGEVTRFRTGAETGDNTPFVTRSFTEEVTPIFQTRCAAACHSGAQGSIADLRLDSSAGISETAINVPADGWPDWKRIVPARPGQSYLLFKLIGDPRISGQQMPRSFDASPATPLTPPQLEIISDWIASGAPFFDPASEHE